MNPVSSRSMMLYLLVLLSYGIVLSCERQNMLEVNEDSISIELGPPINMFSEYVFHLQQGVYSIYKDSSEIEITVRSMLSESSPSYTIRWRLTDEHLERDPQGIRFQDDVQEGEEITLLISLPGSFILIAEVMDEFNTLITSGRKMLYYLDERRIFVTQTGSGNYDGSSWDHSVDGQNFLQDVIDAAGQYMENRLGVFSIWLGEGVYTPPLRHGFVNSQDRGYHLRNKVEVLGGFLGIEGELSERKWEEHPTVLSGDFELSTSRRAYHVFYHTSDLQLDHSAVLDGLYISGGRADGEGLHYLGGGMYNDAASPWIRNVVFRDNYASSHGGAVYNHQSSPLFTEVLFHKNISQSRGGAVHNGPSSEATFINVEFRENSGSLGGAAMHNENANVILANSLFLYNQSSEDSSENGGGAGVYNTDSSTCILLHSGLHGNLSHGSGAALVNISASTLMLRNSVVWGNINIDLGTVDTIYNTAVMNYSHSLVEQLITSGIWNDAYGDNLGGNVSLDPQFVEAGIWDAEWELQNLDLVNLRPAVHSPLIGGGSITDAQSVQELILSRISDPEREETIRRLLSKDIRGIERGEATNIGAYE